MGAMAQKERVRNQPYADLKWLHLGFHVGIHSQDLLLTHTGDQWRDLVRGDSFLLTRL